MPGLDIAIHGEVLVTDGTPPDFMVTVTLTNNLTLNVPQKFFQGAGVTVPRFGSNLGGM